VSADWPLLKLEQLKKEVAEEVKNLCKDYSPLRRNTGKWRIRREENAQNAGEVVNVQLVKNEALIHINRPSDHSIDTYHSSSLLVRSSLRHNPVLFQSLQRLWHLINPYHLKSISKRVFGQLLDLATRHILVIDPKVSTEYILKDLELDYERRKGLVFCEFYDAIFELLDNAARSRLVTEYVLLVRKLCLRLEEENPFPTLDFHNKLHETDSPRRPYRAWMRTTISQLTRSQANSPHSNDFPILFDGPISHSSAFERLSRRQTSIPHDPPLLKTAFRMVAMLTRSQPTSPKRSTLRSPSSTDAANPLRIRRNQSRRKFGRTGYLLHTSPLSTVYRTGRPGTGVLEEVVRDRKREMHRMSTGEMGN
jgi:hypothetical protein